MMNLMKESKLIYQGFLKYGPQFLDDLNTNTITECFFQTLYLPAVQQYIKQHTFDSQDVSYLPILNENDNSMSMSIFGLAPGFVMPIHDHPDMFILSFVLNGTGIRQSWNLKKDQKQFIQQFQQNIINKNVFVNVEKLPEDQLIKDNICYTTPNKNNIHSFINTHKTDPFVFVDLFIPHYDDKANRKISYFKQINDQKLQLISENELF